METRLKETILKHLHERLLINMKLTGSEDEKPISNSRQAFCFLQSPWSDCYRNYCKYKKKPHPSKNSWKHKLVTTLHVQITIIVKMWVYLGCKNLWYFFLVLWAACAGVWLFDVIHEFDSLLHQRWTQNAFSFFFVVTQWKMFSWRKKGMPKDDQIIFHAFEYKKNSMLRCSCLFQSSHG